MTYDSFLYLHVPRHLGQVVQSAVQAVWMQRPRPAGVLISTRIHSLSDPLGILDSRFRPPGRAGDPQTPAQEGRYRAPGPSGPGETFDIRRACRPSVPGPAGRSE